MTAAQQRIVVRTAGARTADGYQSLVEFTRKNSTPLIAYNLDVAVRQLERLRSAIPRAAPYYAVKAAPVPELIRRLAEEGCRFDVASETELNLVLAQGVSAAQCVYTNPVVTPGALRLGLEKGCRRYTIDSVEELEKYRGKGGQVELLLRLAVTNAFTEMDLSRKFGCAIGQVEPCLRRARELRLAIVGLSFHVGSRTTRPDAYLEAIATCAEVLRRHSDYGLRVLNIGGGFPVSASDDGGEESAFLRPISAALSRVPEGIEVLTEPGRYLAEPSGTLLVGVSGVAQKGGKVWYYLEDGCYGSFSGLVFDYATYAISVFGGPQPPQPSVLAGPTCDSFDILSENVLLPPLRVGDVVVVHQIGAYSFASATQFNGMPKAAVLALDDERDPLAAAFATNSP